MMPPRRILVVDDNRDSADSLALLLSLHGHVTRALYSGNGFIELVREFRPELVLLDIGMPGRSGLDLVREVRADPPSHKIRVAAISGLARRGDRESSAQAGFDMHFVKPVDLPTLMDFIERRPIG